MKEKEPRYKMLWVHPELVLTAFGAHYLGKERVVPIISGIPDGFTIDAVHYDFHRDCFGFKIWHQDFDLVSIGSQIPEIYAEIRLVPLSDLLVNQPLIVGNSI